MIRSRFIALLALALMLVGGAAARAQDKIVAAGNKLSAIAPLYIAIEKGLFAEERLDVSLIHLTSSQEIGLAVASGSAQFGMTAITAGIYTMAGKGGVKMIAGGYEEYPGFHGVAIVVNNQAYEQGLKTPKDLAGKKVAITAFGSGSQNQLARLAKKYGFNYGSLEIFPVQTLANEVSAVKNGRVHASPIPATLAKRLADAGDAKIIGWMGDEVPTQFGGLFAAPGTITTRRDVTDRFVRAYVKAIGLYHLAFQQREADGTPVRGAGSEELMRIVSERTGEPIPSLEMALPYFNPEARLHVEDIAEQIDTYKSLRLVEQSLTVEAVLDRSFVFAGKSNTK